MLVPVKSAKFGQSRRELGQEDAFGADKLDNPANGILGRVRSRASSRTFSNGCECFSESIRRRSSGVTRRRVRECKECDVGGMAGNLARDGAWLKPLSSVAIQLARSTAS
jgi:hypothetical protein